MARSHVLSRCLRLFRAEGATAEYNNGVLRVTLPKREETKARRIQVSGSEAGATKKTIETTTETGKAKEATGGR